jgi:hypothetical protein
MMIVDDTHHWMRHANQIAVDSATAAFLEKHLMRGTAAGVTGSQ